MKNKKSRRFLLLLALYGLPMFSSAQSDEAKTIQVFKGEDSTPSYEYALDDTRKIFFGADDFTFTFYSSSNATFRLDEVRCIKFGDGLPSLIESAEDSRSGTQLSISSGMIKAECQAPSVLTIYDITGRPVMKKVVEDSAKISTEQLAPGIYLANINDKTIKFNI